MRTERDEGPQLPDIFDVLRYLEENPVMYNALQEFIRETQQGEEAEWAPLPDNEDEADEWLVEAQWASLPEDNEDGPEVSMAPVEISGDGSRNSQFEKSSWFCHRCDHNLLLPPESTAAQRLQR
uniref:DUF2695 domain-containing protein n=1 Tax=Elaeophora elaphi TaxID=1147741 RepID=A0A0R3RUG5_9BILA